MSSTTPHVPTDGTETFNSPVLSKAAPLVHVVDDAASVTRELRPEAFTDLSQGRLGTWGRPGTRRISWLVADLLIAMGCDDYASGAGRRGEGDLNNLIAWVRARQVEHLFIQNAWLLDYPVLQELLSTRVAMGCHLWLVGDTGVTQRHLDLLSDHARRAGHPMPEVRTGEDFNTHWSQLLSTGNPNAGHRPGSGRAPAPQELFPGPAQDWPITLPSDDFITFLAACRDLLAPVQFQAVHRYFRTCAAEAGALTQGLPVKFSDREYAVAAWLHKKWEDIESWQHFVVLLRATQVAFFHAGLHMRVDPHQVAATATTLPRRATRNAAAWARLSGYCDPYRGAVCALAAAGVTVAQMRDLTLADVSPDGTRASIPKLTEGKPCWVNIEPAAAIYLHAQRELLHVTGASDSSPLLPAAHSGKPMSEVALARTVSLARREFGVAVAARRLTRDPVEGAQWFTRWGIGIQELS